MTINTNHVYISFDREIGVSRAWLRRELADRCGCASEILCDRIAQRLVELGLPRYASAVRLRTGAADDGYPQPGEQINFGRANFQVGSGEVSVSVFQWLANQFEFLLHWAYCAVGILTPRAAASAHQPAVLLIGVGEESLFHDLSDKRFVDYCRNAPIAPLRYGKRFLIQSTTKTASSQPSEFTYCRDPLVELLRGAKLGLVRRIQILFRHAALFVSYAWASSRQPLLSFLARDFAYCRISSELDGFGLIETVVFTAANFTRQPLWQRSLHNAKVHMIWYAQNFRPIVYRADRTESVIPNLRWIAADMHWVWTHSFAQYLRAILPKTEIEAVGPILWYGPTTTSVSENAIGIVVFDVPPYSDSGALSVGEFSNYHNPGNITAFIDAIVSIKPKLEKHFHLPVILRIKSKRKYKPFYHRPYLSYLENLASSGLIILEDSAENIYTLVGRNHLIIAYPFTSPAYVGEALKTPSVYFDPTNSICSQDFADAREYIEFAGSRDSLLGIAIDLLTNRLAIKC